MLSLCPDWKQITLVTPADKKQNIKFYTEKWGFSVGNKLMDGSIAKLEIYKNEWNCFMWK